MRPYPQKISGLGLSGPQKILEPMTITNTITYGAYYNMSADLYTISVTVPRPGSQAAVLDFKYDHRSPDRGPIASVKPTFGGSIEINGSSYRRRELQSMER